MIMSVQVYMWSNEMKKRDQTLSSNGSASTQSATVAVGFEQDVLAKGGMNSVVLAPVFDRVERVNSLLSHCSEDSVSMLVEWFSP